MRYFEDFVAGKFYPLPGAYTLTEKDIVSFASEWDPQPFHIDKAAAEASIFGGLVACSSHLIAIAIRIATTNEEEPSAAISALGFSEIKMAGPARPGDILRVEEEVVATRLSQSRTGAGIVTFGNKLYNQRDELVLSLQTAALMHCRPAPN